MSIFRRQQPEPEPEPKKAEKPKKPLSFTERVREEARAEVHRRYCLDPDMSASAGMAVDEIFEAYGRGAIDRERMMDMIGTILAITTIEMDMRHEQHTNLTRSTHERAKPTEKVPSVAELEAMLRNIKEKP